ncbi:MAG: GNAT family N-acetyltransferase, partial [Candidatus Limnocylindrales bacterium]
MTITIRLITHDETQAWLEALGATFLEQFDAAKVAEEVKPLWDYSRLQGAFDGDLTVGTYRTWVTELTVPGGARVPASAVTSVTVRPTHRRQGILSRMTASEHAMARERGEIAALLYAAEYPIYGRFGYGMGVTTATWTLNAAGTAFHGGDPAGSIELVTAPTTETLASIKSVYEAWRPHRVGEIRRRELMWEFDLGLRESVWGPKWKGYVALHRDADGTVDGYARYRAEQKWTQRQPASILTLDELHALDDEAYRALWKFLADTDLVSTIKAERRRTDEPLPWLLTNARAAEQSEVGDGLWVALLDIPKALGARGYEREGSVVIEAVEGAGTDAEVRTRVALDASPAG